MVTRLVRRVKLSLIYGLRTAHDKIFLSLYIFLNSIILLHMSKYYDVAKLDYLEESDILLGITDAKTEVISLETRLPVLVFQNAKFKNSG